MTQADGQEVLVIEADAGTRTGLERLLKQAGLIPTVVDQPERAYELLRNKYVPVVVVDLDTPSEGAGIGVMREVKLIAPTTPVVILSGRHTFECAAEAFRAGADDVIYKSPDQVHALETCIVKLATRGGGASKAAVAEETVGLFEEFLRRLMETHRKLIDLETRVSGVERAVDTECAVLLVEHDGWLQPELEKALTERGGYALRVASSGGEGMDASTAGRFQVALVSDSLPDLPGSMVVSAVKQQSPETIAILYSRPGRRPGKVEVIEGSKPIVLVPEFLAASQILEHMETLREAYVRKSQERVYLQDFRQQHFELLKRLGSLRSRLQNR